MELNLLEKRCIIKSNDEENFVNKCKGGINVCKKIKELSGKKPDALLSKLGQFDSVPVDISKMCYDLGIRVQARDFTELENSISKEIDDKGNILGLVLIHKDDLAILYKNTDTLNRKRFTLAHELAHCCLHIDPTADMHIEFRRDETSQDEKEKEANIFAGELLIPKKLLLDVIQKMFNGEIKVDMLAKIFVVSENVMKERLRYLEMII